MTSQPQKEDIWWDLDCPVCSLYFSPEYPKGEYICKFGQPDRMYIFGTPRTCSEICAQRKCPRAPGNQKGDVQ